MGSKMAGINKINAVLVILVICLVAAVGLTGKIAWNKFQLNKANAALNEQLMKANLEIGRAHTKFGDADRYAKELEKALKDEIDERDADLTRYGELLLEYKTKGKHQGKGKIVYVQGPKTEGDKFETGQLYQATDNRTLIKIESIGETYSDHRIEATCNFIPPIEPELLIGFEFDYELHLKFAGQLVETITPSGAINHYFTMWEIDETGERIGKVDIIDYTTVVTDQRSKKFFWWAPHVDIGLIAGGGFPGGLVGGGSMGFSVMGYGLTDNDLQIRMLRLAVSLSGAMGSKLLPGIGVTPAQYNLGEHIPLISNLWVGPHVGYKLDGSWFLALEVSAVL